MKTQSQESRNAYFLQFREAYYTQFSIPEYLQARLTLYKRSVWSAEFFLACWDSSADAITAGTVAKYNSLFHIEFCSGCSLQKIRELNSQSANLQLALSFRTAKNFPSYVLVDFQRVQNV